MQNFTSRATAPAVAVATSFLFGLAAPSFAEDTSLEKARGLIGEGKAREALEVLKTIKGQEGDPGFLALRGEGLMDLGRYTEAKADLEKAQKDAGEAGYARIRLAQIEFLYGRDEKAAALLKGMEIPKGWESFAKTLPLLIDGPFAEKWGDAARACRARSKDGHYQIYCDVGMDDATAARVEAKAKPIRAKGGKDVEAKLEKAIPTLESALTAGRLMDLIYKAYGKVFQLPKDEGLVHRVYVFAHREDFLAFSRKIGHDVDFAAGYFALETRILAVDASAAAPEGAVFADDTVDTLFHEGMHQFVHYFVPDMPIWFNEGLAEYFGPSQLVSKTELRIGVVENRRAKPGQPMTRLDTIRAAMTGEIDEKPLPLRQLMSLDAKRFVEKDQIHVNYAQSWSFVHYLMSTDRGAKIVRTYFKVLRDGKGEKVAFKEAFGKEDIEAMEKEWKAYVKRI